jgi:hypothetical protein
MRKVPFAPNAPAAPQQDGGLGNVIRNAVGNAMQEVRSELQDKLAELREERADISRDLAQAGSRVERARLQSRIDRLDQQINELQTGLDKLGAEVGGGGPAVRVGIPTVGVAPQLPNFPIQPRIDPVPIIGTTLGILFVAFPLALTISRYIWKRSTSAPAPALSAEQTRRFDRLEQSVDAIAIEIERISENQRYLTRVLADSKQAASVGSGSAVSK